MYAWRRAWATIFVLSKIVDALHCMGRRLVSHDLSKRLQARFWLLGTCPLSPTRNTSPICETPQEAHAFGVPEEVAGAAAFQ